jgi:peptidoglycan/xylan/chitin deacetylase (PgdA/CDA1 family)
MVLRILVRTFFVIICLVLFSGSIYSQHLNKDICITVDDLPVVTTIFKDNATGKYITDKLLRTFKKYKVTALGSVNSGKMVIEGRLDTIRLSFLEQWLDSGMVLANHTYSHKDYNKINFEEFRKDIVDGELYLKELLQNKGQELKYFRHPFLFRGYTKEKADTLQNYLDSIGYTVAPVTIDNADYLFAFAYEKAKSLKDEPLCERIGNDYIQYMDSVLNYYEIQSIKLLGYNPEHILLCHASLLNADYMDRLLEMYQKNGYKFINIEDALKDSCYSTYKDEYYKKAGISWIHRWAYTLGHRGDYFKGEPDVPQYVDSLSKR